MITTAGADTAAGTTTAAARRAGGHRLSCRVQTRFYFTGVAYVAITADQLTQIRPSSSLFLASTLGELSRLL